MTGPHDLDHHRRCYAGLATAYVAIVLLYAAHGDMAHAACVLAVALIYAALSLAA
ncbi:hypothetical protein [Methylobacterium oryzihabitans]|uniref:hypothetical protein n=1 Tax=Methylobacterium oryzihabitans TaxID=2499852 RepID=UPI0016525160|nr:hypothetical protein [Methylobacterium oryzihabitans]